MCLFSYISKEPHPSGNNIPLLNISFKVCIKMKFQFICLNIQEVIGTLLLTLDFFFFPYF